MIKAAQLLNIEYDANVAYFDAKAWVKMTDARDYTINSRLKYKPDYIATQVAQNQMKLQANIRRYNIPIHGHVSIDETMVWHDFCISAKTLSLPGRNEPVLWIPNDKDTTTIIGIWKFNKFSIHDHHFE